MAIDPSNVDFTVPTTVSEHAQSVLRSLGSAAARGAGAAADIHSHREKFEAMAAPASAEAKEKYLMKAEDLELAGVPVIRVTPKGYNPSQDGRIGLYIHGGGYTMMSPEVTMHAYAPIASFLGE